MLSQVPGNVRRPGGGVFEQWKKWTCFNISKTMLSISLYICLLFFAVLLIVMISCIACNSVIHKHDGCNIKGIITLRQYLLPTVTLTLH